MFEQLIKLTTEEGLKSRVKTITSKPEPEAIQPYIYLQFDYDEESETITTVTEGDFGNGYNVDKDVYTVDEKLNQILRLDVRSSLRAVEKKLKQITGDEALRIFVMDVLKKINIAVSNYNSYKSVRDRSVIKYHLNHAIEGIKNLFGEKYTEHIYTLKRDIGNVGNPNFRANEIDLDIHKLVEVANNYLKKEPHIYKPVRSGSFLGDTLKITLAEDFNVAPSTLRDHMKKKCEKDGRLYKVKIGY